MISQSNCIAGSKVEAKILDYSRGGMQLEIIAGLESVDGNNMRFAFSNAKKDLDLHKHVQEELLGTPIAPIMYRKVWAEGSFMGVKRLVA